MWGGGLLSESSPSPKMFFVVRAVMRKGCEIIAEIGASNIECTLELLGGDANRWRVHIKTAKLSHTLRMLVDHGIRNFKCATTLELLVACGSGAGDVLFAYPAVGASVRRVREIADQFPGGR